MNLERPLVGYYSSGQHVIVRGQDHGNNLRLLGYYGNDLDHAKRRDGLRMGPLDRQLADTEADEKCKNHITLLTLQEAFFLAYAMGCLKIVSDINPETTLSLIDCWTEFRAHYVSSNIHIDFAIDYGVYHFLRSRGWVVKPGDNYGTNYILYREGPSIDHAQYAALIINEQDPSRAYSWESLLTFHRVIQSVSKQLLLINVTPTNDSNISPYSHPTCIKNMKITTQVFTATSSLPIN